MGGGTGIWGGGGTGIWGGVQVYGGGTGIWGGGTSRSLYIGIEVPTVLIQ